MRSFPLLLLAVTASAATHPLDPLGSVELSSAVAAVRRAKALPEGTFFPYVALQEPPKAELAAWEAGKPFRREAFVIVFDRPKNALAEAVVDLKTGELRSWTPRPGLQPNVMLDEFNNFPALVRRDPGWRAAIAKRGLDPDGVWLDVWAPGPLSAKESAGGRRLLRALAFLSQGNKNPYAHPVEGVVAVIDANAGKVLEVLDTGVVAMTPASGDFDPGSLPAERPGLKPLEISQPQGPSFTIDGHELRWQGWRFRFALNPREGPVVYQAAFQDGGRWRSVMHRGSLSEMLVPYGDPDRAWSWRSAFDEGEYGIGRMAGPLEPLKDAPPNAVFLDADFADDLGKPYKVERAMALYERDGGLLWKHYDLVNGRNDSRWGRELVLSFVATISNYDYQLSWVFRQDGSIALESALTGIMLAKGVPAGAHAGHAHGHPVARGVAAPHHQHFFNFRLDLDVDGPENVVTETEVRAAPAGAGNPLGNVMLMSERALKSEAAAKRTLNLASARKWRVLSARARNEHGEPTGFALIPGENAVPYLRPEAPVRRKGAFIDHHLWVTRQREGELHAAGWYPNQAAPGAGLPAWTKDDETLEGEDVVLWYTFGVTHLPRPEDWPVMPVHRAGFSLIPSGFFGRNPALDIR